MTRLGTLRVTAPPPSPPQTSPPQPTTPAQRCNPPQTPQTPRTPSTSTPNPSPQPPTPLRQPPLSKNLRWTAVALVSKLSKELERPSSAIADEVALAASHDMRTRFPGKDVAPVERNTRRRVYDALKVMVAVGCIQRHGKDLRWIGVDHLRYLKANNGPNIRVSLCESRRRIGRKKAMLTEIHRTLKAFDAHYNRHHREHQWRNHQSTRLTISHRIQFPMIVINAQHPQVTYSPDRKRVRVATQAPFKVYSETDLVTMLTDRTALKRPKVAKKRRSTRGTSGTSHSPDPPPASSFSGARSNLDHLGKSSQATNVDQNFTARKHANAISVHNDVNTADISGPSTPSIPSTRHKRDSSGTKNVETRAHAPISTDSRKKRRIQDDDKENSELELQKEIPIKVEPEETTIVNAVPASSGPSSRQDGPDTESVCPNAASTQGERSVITGPLICNEELGIPPLEDGDSSSPGSDDDPMTECKAGEEGHDFDQVFAAPMFR